MKANRKAPNKVFSNTYGRGSNKVLNGTVQEQLDWFNGQKSLVQTWMDNVDQKIRELNAIRLGTKPALSDTIQTVSESVRLITQNNDINEGVLKLTYLNLFSILECMKPSNMKHIDEYIQRTAPNEILKDWNNIDDVRIRI